MAAIRDTPQPDRRRTIHHFGSTAPPLSLPFPTRANMTAVEILTFFPNTIHCSDVIYRLISNGGTRHIIWAIINTARDLEEEWSLNCCGTYMSKTMREAGYENWTTKKHHKWLEDLEESWNAMNVGVGGMRTALTQNDTVSVQSMPFKDLAAGVRNMPSGGEALDLTRMVMHCIQNPEQTWLYPQDYERLLTYLGGPCAIRSEHSDNAVFQRWEGRNPPPIQPKLESTVVERGDRERKRRKTQKALEEEEREQELLHFRLRPASKAQTQKSVGGVQESEIRRGPDARKTTKQSDLNNPYRRGLALYVSPPEIYHRACSSQIRWVFMSQAAVGELDQSSPYAFGGPRSSPPYRTLHHIDQPHPLDTSGWAENLRWAFEQRVCFGHQEGPWDWTESPEHMEFVAQVRKEQDWMSDDMLEVLESFSD